MTTTQVRTKKRDCCAQTRAAFAPGDPRGILVQSQSIARGYRAAADQGYGQVLLKFTLLSVTRGPIPQEMLGV